jgi:hypothetical protein
LGVSLKLSRRIKFKKFFGANKVSNGIAQEAASHNQTRWLRYAHNICSGPHWDEELGRFFTFVNIVCQNIIVTMDVQEEKSLSLLDMLVLK